jgi:hypothetical protein
MIFRLATETTKIVCRIVLTRNAPVLDDARSRLRACSGGYGRYGDGA